MNPSFLIKLARIQELAAFLRSMVTSGVIADQNAKVHIAELDAQAAALDLPALRKRSVMLDLYTQVSNDQLTCEIARKVELSSTCVWSEMKRLIPGPIMHNADRSYIESSCDFASLAIHFLNLFLVSNPSQDEVEKMILIISSQLDSASVVRNKSVADVPFFPPSLMNVPYNDLVTKAITKKDDKTNTETSSTVAEWFRDTWSVVKAPFSEILSMQYVESTLNARDPEDVLLMERAMMGELHATRSYWSVPTLSESI